MFENCYSDTFGCDEYLSKCKETYFTFLWRLMSVDHLDLKH